MKMDIFKEMQEVLGGDVTNLILLWVLIACWFIRGHKINAQKDKIEDLNVKINELERLQPQVMIKQYNDNLAMLSNLCDKVAAGEIAISEANKKIQSIEEENKSLKSYFEEIQDQLLEIVRPRSGKVNYSLLKSILEPMATENSIIFRISPYGSDDLSMENPSPLLLMEDYGMGNMWLFVTDNNGNNIGKVENPYPLVYKKDYYQTLLFALKNCLIQRVESGGGPPVWEIRGGALDRPYQYNPSQYIVKVVNPTPPGLEEISTGIMLE